MERRGRPGARAWLLGGLITAALWLFLCLYADIHFAVNDDQFMLRAFTGYEPGGAPTFHLYIHGMYAFPLRWLNVLFPGVPWFSVLEIALLSLGLTTIVKSVLQCAGRAGGPEWAGLLLALSYGLLYGLAYLARVTYTVTAALLGAAAAAQVLSVDCEQQPPRRVFGSLLYALLLAVLCYGLRQMTALPALAYCAVAFLLQFLRHYGLGKAARRSPRPMVAAALTVALVMGGLAAGRELEIDGRGQREYLNWQQARISVLDYIDISQLPPEALAEAGWSDTENRLLLQWYTMDESVSAEGFRTLRENWRNEQTRTSPGAAVEDLRLRSPGVIFTMALLAALGALCLLLFFLRRRECRWQLWATLCTGGGCFLFFAYLALEGRLPYRAVTVPLFGAAALVFCLLPEALAAKAGAKAVLQKALCLLLCLCSLGYGVYAASLVKRQPAQWDYNTFEDMDAQALAHPELLLIYDTDLVNDMRMFPDTSAGTPANLMFWGGWQRGSPEYLARLSAFGIDGEHFTARDWLNPSVRFLSLKEEPNPLLLQYLREEIGPGVAYQGEKVSEGLYFYRFFVPASSP